MGEIGEMPDDEEVAKQIGSLRESSENIENLLDLMISAKAYDRLSTEDQVKHDLFVSYALTSLYWMYMRTLGENPFTHVVKGEIDRIQDYVKKYQRVKDRKKRPTVQKDAAKRFVKSGLWDPSTGPQPSNKRKRFEDDD
uniref:Nuclear nucleic acid-binding protein C1D n=1 Tax=Lygus hesperus TaxID=30085 RepID=A0A0A9WDV8_LYGHE